MVFSFLAIILNETILSCVCADPSVSSRNGLSILQKAYDSHGRSFQVLSGPFRSFQVLSGPLLKWEVLMKGLHFEVLWGLGYIYISLSLFMSKGSCFSRGYCGSPIPCLPLLPNFPFPFIFYWSRVFVTHVILFRLSPPYDKVGWIKINKATPIRKWPWPLAFWAILKTTTRFLIIKNGAPTPYS